MKTELLKTQTNEYVYDISLDGTFIDAFTCLVEKNTDGFNFELPKKYRYTKDKPYVGKGLNREVKLGKEYTGFEADVAEFNDLYMCDKHYHPLAVNKMGLGIDEIADKAIGKTLSDAKYAGAVLTDAKALKVLEAAEGVVLIEKLFATTYNDFEKELQLCKRLNIPVVGCIVVR